MKAFLIGFLMLVCGVIMLCYEISQTKTYCGVIRHKIDAVKWGKYSAKADPVFVVRFDNPNKDYEIHPTWADYMDFNVGDRVCYTLQIHEVEDKEGKAIAIVLLSVILMVAGLCVMIFGTFIPEL